MNRLLPLLLALLLPAAAVAQITSSPQTVNGPLVVQGNAYVNGGGMCVNPLGSTGGNAGGICTNALNSQITSGGNLGFPIAGTLGLTLGTTGGATLGSPTGGMPAVGVLNTQGLEINGQSFSTIPGSSPITPEGATSASPLSVLLSNPTLTNPIYVGNVKYEQACTGVAAHDDPIVTDAFTWASTNIGTAILSGAPNCDFTTPVAITSNNSNWGVTCGPGTTLLYSGTNTTTNLVSINAVTPYAKHITLSGCMIRSATTMTAGAALYAQGILQLSLRNFYLDSAFGSPGQNLWNGAVFDNDNSTYWIGGESYVQNDAVEDYSDVSGVDTVDTYLIGVEIDHSKNGIHAGYGAGGLYCIDSDVVLNGTGGGQNVLIDEALGLSSNSTQQVFLFPSCLVDSSSYNGVFINDNASIANANMQLEGWVSANALNGIDIKNCDNCVVQIDAKPIQDNTSDGVLIESTNAKQIVIDGAIVNNGGWGVFCNTASTPIYFIGAVANNTSGTIGSGCTIEANH